MNKKTFKHAVLSSCILFAISANANEGGFTFNGYAKGGIGITNDDILSPGGYNWADNGMNIFRLPGNTYTNSSGGRLGNEANWLELHFGYGWEQKNDMDWTIQSNIVHGDGGLALDELAIQSNGIIQSNPEAVIWAGKRYYNRVETFLTDSQSMSNDGLGFGLENYDLGFGKLHLGVSRNIYEEAPEDGAGELVAFTSSLSFIELTDNLTLNLYANYGTPMGPDSENKTDDKPDAYQLASKLLLLSDTGYDELFIRYSKNASGSMTRSWEALPDYQIGGFWQGVHSVTDNYTLSYIWQHETASFDEKARQRADTRVKDSHWNAFVARNSYTWNERTSTELELGYEFIDITAVDSSQDGTNSGYKVTLSQNLHIASDFWERPVIRFFVTYAEQDVETLAYDRWDVDLDSGVTTGKSDALTFGAQFEAWW
ncbi:carbohydrate porin [Photobacterium sp. DNB23_23_1]